MFSHVHEVGRARHSENSFCHGASAYLPDEERLPILAPVDALFDTHTQGDFLRLPYSMECFRAGVRNPKPS